MKTAPELLHQYIENLVLNQNPNKKLDDETAEDYCQQMAEEIRGGQFKTNISAPYSRHYETQSVSMHIDFEGYCGYIGWTYWFGGGKHGNPGDIEWIEDAYFLDCEEKEIMTIKRTWTKR